MGNTVGYLVNIYPAISQTFIRREIRSLENHGVVVLRMALRGKNDHLPDEKDLVERGRTRYVLDGGISGLAGGLMYVARRSPRRLWQSAVLTFRMWRGSHRPLHLHLAYLAEASVVLRWLDAAGATHLHAHFATNSAEIAMLTHALGGPPYSFTAHGSDISDRPAQIGLPLTVARAKFVVAVCAYGRSQICKWVPHVHWKKIHVIRCGLQSSFGSTTKPTQPATSTQFVCIGRLSPEKGHLILIDAAALLRDRGIAFTIVLVGEGPMRELIEKRIDELGLSSYIRLTGSLDAEGVQFEMLASRALVVTSLSEGLPVVIMEAMALRRVVLAPYLAGIPELVIPGRNGWLFPAADAMPLSLAMIECLSTTDDDLEQMGALARIDVMRTHDVDTETEKLMHLMISNAH